MPRVRIEQPEGVNYMIQKTHWNSELAQEYLNMLIEKSEVYIAQKLQGKHVAPLMTIEQLNIQLENLKKCKIVTIEG